MIRLVTQFDEFETHASLATPTCGCCCCCCCCLASAISSSTLPAFHVSAINKSRPPEEHKRFTAGLALSALAITLTISVATAGLGLIVAPAIWAFFLWIAYRRAGSPNPVMWGILVALLGSLAIVVEFFLAFAMIDALDAYAGMGLLVGIGITILGSAKIK